LRLVGDNGTTSDVCGDDTHGNSFSMASIRGSARWPREGPDPTPTRRQDDQEASGDCPAGPTSSSEASEVRTVWVPSPPSSVVCSRLLAARPRPATCRRHDRLGTPKDITGQRSRTVTPEAAGSSPVHPARIIRVFGSALNEDGSRIHPVSVTS
jgi:hypothetical protein